MIVVKGLHEAIAALQAKGAAVDAATRVATATVLEMMGRAAKEQLAKTSHSKGTPTPSAPGEPPSLVSGNLRNSIAVKGPDSIPGGYQGQVGPTAVYGRVQELGGGPRRLPARPYMQPAYDSLKDKIPGIYRNAWLAAVMK